MWENEHFIMTTCVHVCSVTPGPNYMIGRGKSSNNGWRRFAPFRVYGARSIMQNYDGVERPLLSDGIYMALLDVAMTC